MSAQMLLPMGDARSVRRLERLEQRWFALWRRACRVRHYDGRTWPICWDVRMRQPVTFMEVFDQLCNQRDWHGRADAVVTLGLTLDAIEAQYVKNEAACWQEAVNDMQRSLNGTDTYRCCSPTVYKRWGLAQSTPDLWDVRYEFHGRNAGWLCMTHFQGVGLDTVLCSPDQNLFQYREHTGDPYAWLQRLCCMVDEVTHCVNNRQEELVYLMAYQFGTWLDPEE